MELISTPAGYVIAHPYDPRSRTDEAILTSFQEELKGLRAELGSLVEKYIVVTARLQYLTSKCARLAESKCSTDADCEPNASRSACLPSRAHLRVQSELAAQLREQGLRLADYQV